MLLNVCEQSQGFAAQFLFIFRALGRALALAVLLGAMSVVAWGADTPGGVEKAGPKFSPEQSMTILATMPGFYEVASPADVSALIAGRSLAGVRGGNDNDLTPLMAAAATTPYPEVVNMLAAAGCLPNAATTSSIKYPPPRWAPWWRRLDPDTFTYALELAVQNPNQQVLGAFLQLAPSQKALTAALSAAAGWQGGLPHLTLLLQAGAQPGKDVDSLWEKIVGMERFRPNIKSGWEYRLRHTPDEALQMTRALLGAGVPATQAALRSALLAGQTETAMALLDAGVSPDFKARASTTALHLALIRPLDPVLFSSSHLPHPTPELIARLANKANVNLRCPKGTPLELACAAGMGPGVIKALTDAGAKLNPKDSAVLFLAIDARDDADDSTLKYLLSQGFSPTMRNSKGRTALQYALPYNIGAARILVATGARPDPSMILDPTRHENDQRAKKFQESVRQPESPAAAAALCDAVRREELANVQLLLNAKVPQAAIDAALNCDNSYYGSGDTLALLLDHGANPKTARKSPGREYTLIHTLAARHNDTVLAQALGAGGEVNVANDMGGTPLMLAVNRDSFVSFGPEQPIPAGQRRCIELLLQAGADINAVDDSGRSVLMLGLHNPAITRFLLEKGALAAPAGAEAVLPFAAKTPSTADSIPVLLEYGDPQVMDKQGPELVRVIMETNNGHAAARVIQTRAF